jgi:hypothetical protein
MYKEALIQESSSKSANVGALVGVAGSAASLIGFGVMSGVGSGVAASGIASGSIAKAQFGFQLKSAAIANIANTLGGNGGLAIAGNMYNAYKSDEKINELKANINTMQINTEPVKVSSQQRLMPFEYLNKNNGALK